MKEVSEWVRATIATKSSLEHMPKYCSRRKIGAESLLPHLSQYWQVEILYLLSHFVQIIPIERGSMRKDAVMIRMEALDSCPVGIWKMLWVLSTCPSTLNLIQVAGQSRLWSLVLVDGQYLHIHWKVMEYALNYSI